MLPYKFAFEGKGFTMMTRWKRHKNPYSSGVHECNSQNGQVLQPSSLDKSPTTKKKRPSPTRILWAFLVTLLFVWLAFLFVLSKATSSIEPHPPFKSNSVINLGNDDLSKPILMVGGSDGSGTRAFVQTLRELGTFTIAEDKVTFDMHASAVAGGWPGLIRHIFLPFGRNGFFSVDEQRSSNLDSAETNISANGTFMSITENNFKTNFDWPPERLDTDDDTKNFNDIEADIEKLLTSWDTHYKYELARRKNPGKGSTSRMVQRAMAAAGAVSRDTTMYPNAVANDVSYAIKAPVSMLALPVFAAVYSSFSKGHRKKPRPLKFLHVIRDGRDVALSNNQSPVVKFYNLTYPKETRDHKSFESKFSASLKSGKEDRIYAKAMQLWNDWNLVVHRWATNHSIDNPISGARNDADFPAVDYLWVRSEDLIVPGSRKRLDALTAIAKFVGSSLRNEDLCCLSRQDPKDFGQSHNVGEGTRFKTPRKASRFRPMQPISIGSRSRLHVVKSVVDYDSWKDFAKKALLAENAKKSMIQNLIQQGHGLLARLQERLEATNATDHDINDIKDLGNLLSKLQVKAGRRRLLAEDFGSWDTNMMDNNTNTNKNHTEIAHFSNHHKISKRYGKWQKLLENRTELSDFFHREGSEGLRVFGYNPYRKMDYTQEYGNAASPGTMTENLRNSKFNIAAKDEVDDEIEPGICEVSVACPTRDRK